MTGELCDCFLNRQQGVYAILDAVSAVAGDRPVQIWSAIDGFVDMQHARENPIHIASANWHALASWLAQLHPGQRNILIDTGSTTTDIIPMIDGIVAANGKTDAQRLVEHELVYLGGSLTPLMALSARMHGALMNEFFATMLDLAVVIGACPQQPDNNDSPDGRPYDTASCLRRLLRMVGQDLNDDWQMSDYQHVVACLLDAAVGMIRSAFDVVAHRHEPIQTVIVSGSGSWLPCRMLAEHASSFEVIELQTLGDQASSTCACARALLGLACQLD
ncbi:MAG: hydantoinase/oxoprolinase family protein [Phycisphaeraceae bacterium JB051]